MEAKKGKVMAEEWSDLKPKLKLVKNGGTKMF